MDSTDHQSFVEQAQSAFAADASPDESLVLADFFIERGDTRNAATALDRAYGLNPDDPIVKQRRQSLLDELELIEHGLRFRYVPAGTFLMGSDHGDHDERPVHPVRLGEYWVSETTVTWATFCDICKLDAPPSRSLSEDGFAEQVGYSNSWSFYKERLKEDDPQQYEEKVRKPNLKLQCTVESARTAKRVLQYDTKPVVCVSAKRTEKFFRMLSKTIPGISYHLPTEEQWEKAARGGRIGQRFPWGDSPPTHDLCDFDSLANNSIRPSKSLPPNGYGLYAMCGGVWEQTSDKYDSMAYENGTANVRKKKQQAAFRGGSWADCAEATTVSFRNSAVDSESPTFGFRIFRTDERKR